MSNNQMVAMEKTLPAVVLDDQTVMFDGRNLSGIDEVAEAIRLVMEREPHFVLFIEGVPEKHWEGIGTVIYGSNQAGFDLDNLRHSW